jgi:hypothetical protein
VKETHTLCSLSTPTPTLQLAPSSVEGERTHTLCSLSTPTPTLQLAPSSVEGERTHTYAHSPHPHPHSNSHPLRVGIEWLKGWMFRDTIKDKHRNPICAYLRNLREPQKILHYLLPLMIICLIPGTACRPLSTQWRGVQCVTYPCLSAKSWGIISHADSQINRSLIQPETSSLRRQGSLLPVVIREVCI